MSDKKGKNSQAEQQEIIQTFQQLRNEQRSLVSKITELEQDLNEHKVVLETLSEVSNSRRCFRMVGGVLVERTVAEVTPALANNRDQLTKLLENMNDMLIRKGKEINDYREKHGIRVRGQEPPPPSADSEKASSSGGVLVANKS
ncbi:Prefoldin beta-like [Trinorchestia longiramus]|nr:Prefoldin beta-like [Trinorchestia longiramus]